MEIPYTEQHKNKQKNVEQLLSPFVFTISFFPTETLQFYRNRADWWYDPTSQLGFRKKENNYETFSAEKCQLVSPEAQKVYQLIQQEIQKKALAPYSVLAHEGFLRYVFIRESKSHSMQRIVAFVTFNTENPEKMETIARVLLDSSFVSGVVWIINSQWNDQIQGDVFRIWGNGELVEKINGIDYRYNALCFFQTNPKMAGKLQAVVEEKIQEKVHVLDLFCGVGLFSLPLIAKGHFVKGVELSKDSIAYARKNAYALGLGDDAFAFEVGEVPVKLTEMEKAGEKYDSIIVDPPRAGLSKKILRRMLRLQPTQILYISCNPSALARDLHWLQEYAEFTILHAAGFDLFPHTDHVECIVDIRIEKIKEFPKGGF